MVRAWFDRQGSFSKRPGFKQGLGPRFGDLGAEQDGKVRYKPRACKSSPLANWRWRRGERLPQKYTCCLNQKMLEQSCRGKWVFRKKEAKPPPVPRANPPVLSSLRSPPCGARAPAGTPGAPWAARGRQGCDHGARDSPRASEQGMPLLTASPGHGTSPSRDTAGTQLGHGRDGQRTEPRPPSAPMGVAVGTGGGLLAPSTLQQRCRAAG